MTYEIFNLDVLKATLTVEHSFAADGDIEEYLISIPAGGDARDAVLSRLPRGVELIEFRVEYETDWHVRARFRVKYCVPL